MRGSSKSLVLRFKKQLTEGFVSARWASTEASTIASCADRWDVASNSLALRRTSESSGIVRAVSKRRAMVVCKADFSCFALCVRKAPSLLKLAEASLNGLERPRSARCACKSILNFDLNFCLPDNAMCGSASEKAGTINRMEEFAASRINASQCSYCSCSSACSSTKFVSTKTVIPNRSAPLCTDAVDPSGPIRTTSSEQRPCVHRVTRNGKDHAAKSRQVLQKFVGQLDRVCLPTVRNMGATQPFLPK